MLPAFIEEIINYKKKYDRQEIEGIIIKINETDNIRTTYVNFPFDFMELLILWKIKNGGYIT